MTQVSRREFLIAACWVLMPLTVRAQAKLPTVGLLGTDAISASPFKTTLLQALRAKGYVVGQNIQIDDRVALEGYRSLPETAAGLVVAKVDVIVTYGGTATRAAAKATRNIPVVFIVGVDPVTSGFTSSLARPDANLTGVATITLELSQKRLQLLKELVPNASRVGVLVAPESAAYEANQREIETALRTLNLEARFSEVRSPDDLDGAFARFSQARVGALYITGGSMLAANAPRVIALVARYRFPAVYAVQSYADAGGLMVYGPDTHQAVALAANYVDRVLKGAKPSELAIEQMSKIHLVVNLKAAREIGLRVPPSVLLRADRVIE